jgi:hypothetical protein
LGFSISDLKDFIAVPFKERIMQELQVASAQIANYLFWLKPLLFVGHPLAEANGNDIYTSAFDVQHSVFDIKKPLPQASRLWV